MHNTHRGFSSLIVIVLVVILGIIAYSVFKKTSHAPTETPVLETTDTTQEQTVEYKKVPTTTQTSGEEQDIQTLSNQDLQDLESETELLQADIDDLMFEDLGIE